MNDAIAILALIGVFAAIELTLAVRACLATHKRMEG